MERPGSWIAGPVAEMALFPPCEAAEVRLCEAAERANADEMIARFTSLRRGFSAVQRGGPSPSDPAFPSVSADHERQWAGRNRLSPAEEWTLKTAS